MEKSACEDGVNFTLTNKIGQAIVPLIKNKAQIPKTFLNPTNVSVKKSTPQG